MHDSLGSDRSVEFEDLAQLAVDAQRELVAAGELQVGQTAQIVAHGAVNAGAHMILEVLPQPGALGLCPIPGKGKVLTSLTDFWFKQLEGVCPNHLTGIDPESVVKPEEVPMVKGRSCVAMRLKPILIECVARGYLIGGGWKDYCATGCVCGIKLPEGLQMGQKLPEPIFTPAAKAEVGTHDENISFERVVELYGEEIAEKIRSYTLELYRRASEYAATKGIIIADTKFEFGIDEEGTIRLMDEVCTPDSSRFWPADQYNVGVSPPSYDKQFIRDWLEAQPWDKTPPAPKVPDEVIEKTSDKYREALRRLAETDIEQ